MAIQDLKFKEGDFSGKDVESLPDNPSVEGISAAQLKARFDHIAKMMVALGKYNELVDALTAATAAGEIGAAAIGEITGDNIQAVLENLKALGDANKAELLGRIGERIPKTDVVQMRGRSETQVMSQKAVTDAIDAGGGGGGGGGEFEPVGCMKFFAGETLPDGYLWCDGQSYPANGVYKKLFEAVGTRYNQSGDAEGTFRVPDMRGRVGVGKDAGTFDALGKTGGEETQKYGLENGYAKVSFQSSGNPVGTRIRMGRKSIAQSESPQMQFVLKPDSYTGETATAFDMATPLGGTTDEDNNLQPYLVCNYIIKFDRSYEEIGVSAPPVIWDFAVSDWQEQEGGGYVLSIPESEHRRGQHCVLTALYDTTEAGKLKAVLFEMEKNEAGDIWVYSDSAFAGKAYIDRVYMVSAGRVLSVNGQTPDMDGNVAVTEVGNAQKLGGKTENQLQVAHAQVAVSADKLNGQYPTYYAKQADLNALAALPAVRMINEISTLTYTTNTCWDDGKNIHINIACYHPNGVNIPSGGSVGNIANVAQIPDRKYVAPANADAGTSAAISCVASISTDGIIYVNTGGSAPVQALQFHLVYPKHN